MRHTKVVCTERVSWSQSNARWVYKSETWEDIPKWGLSMTEWRIRQCVVSGSQAMGMEGFEDFFWEKVLTYVLWLSCPQLDHCFAMFCCSSRVLICSMHVHRIMLFLGCGSEWLDLQKESRLIFDQNMTRSAVPLAPYFEPSRYLGSCWIVGKRKKFQLCMLRDCLHARQETKRCESSQ